jgi:RNAse P Rpr2/Rpp21/SNM1 subunit domain
MRMCTENIVDLPPSVSDRLCRHCHIVQLPSITCTVRINRRVAGSRINRNGVKRVDAEDADGDQKYSNEVVKTCLVCKQSSVKLSGCIREKGNKIKTTPVPPLPAAATAQVAPASQTKSSGRFSFLNAADIRRTSAPGRLQDDFIQLPCHPSAVTSTPVGKVGGNKRPNLFEMERSQKKLKRNSESRQHASLPTAPPNRSSDSTGSLTSIKNLFGKLS